MRIRRANSICKYAFWSRLALFGLLQGGGQTSSNVGASEPKLVQVFTVSSPSVRHLFSGQCKTENRASQKQAARLTVPKRFHTLAGTAHRKHSAIMTAALAASVGQKKIHSEDHRAFCHRLLAVTVRFLSEELSVNGNERNQTKLDGFSQRKALKHSAEAFCYLRW